MTASLVWANLVAYSVQVLVLVAAGGLLPLLLRIHQPRTQLLYFRLLLAAGLLLPALQPWRRPVVTLAPPSAAVTAPAAPAVSPSPVRPEIRWEEVGLGDRGRWRGATHSLAFGWDVAAAPPADGISAA